MSKRTEWTVRGWISGGLIAAACGAAAALPATAAAQTPGVRAQVRAVASPWMPTVTRVQLQAEEATDVDQQIEQAITQALATRGITVDPAAPMILSYDTQISSETVSSAAGSEPTVDQTELGAPGMSEEQAPPLDVGPQYGEQLPTSLPQALTVTVGPSGVEADQGLVTPAGIIPETPSGGGMRLDPPGGRPYSLIFTLGMDAAPPVWTGSITTSLPEQNPIAVGRFLVAPLVAAIGRSGTTTVVIPNPHSN